MLLWKRYVNNKMAAMRSLHLQQYSHRLNLLYVFLIVFVLASSMSDACNSILLLFLLVVLGVFYIGLLALIYLDVIYCYFVLYLGSVITTPTGNLTFPEPDRLGG